MTDQTPEPVTPPGVDQIGANIDTVAPPLQPSGPAPTASAEPGPWDTVVAAVARASQHDNTAGDEILAQIRNHRGGWLTLNDDGTFTDATGALVDHNQQAVRQVVR